MAEVGTLFSTQTDFSAVVDPATQVNGVFNMSLWESEADATKFYGTNGTFISSDNGDSSTYTDLVGTGTIGIADTTGILVGMWCYVDDVSAGSNAVGYYGISTVTTNTSITIDTTTNLDGGGLLNTNDTVSYYIGGIYDCSDGGDLQDALDFIGPACGATSGNAINNLDILYHSSVAATAIATVDIDTISGSTTTRVRVIGTNSSFVDDGTQVTIDTNTVLSNGLFQLSGGGYVTYRNIEFAAGDNTNDAAYCINAVGTTDGTYSAFINCQMHGATSHNIRARTTGLQIIGCDVYNGGANGYDTIGSQTGAYISHSTFRDNASGTGIRGRFTFATITHCILSNNLNGIDELLGSCAAVRAENNVFKDNTNGISLNAGSTLGDYVNNTFIDNTTFGIDFNGAAVNVFGFNHHDGTGDAADIATTDAAWLILLDGNNIIGDAALNASFIPSSASVLIDAGVGGTGDTIGAKCAAAGGAGGGVMPLTGLLT